MTRTNEEVRQRAAQKRRDSSRQRPKHSSGKRRRNSSEMEQMATLERESSPRRKSRKARRAQLQPGIRKIQVLRYIFCGLILVYVGFTFLFAGGSTKTFDEVAESIEIAVEADHLERLDSRELKRLYGLNSADYDGAIVYASTSGMSAEEVLLIKVKFPDQMSEVEDAVQAYLENRRRDFEEYALEQARLVTDRAYCIRGDFLFVAVSKHAEQYRSVFLKSL